MRLRIGYPDRASEREILASGELAAASSVREVMGRDELLALQERAAQVTVDPSIEDYLLSIVERTRKNDALALGVSPRGAQAFYRASQALALAEGREYVIPDDVKRVAAPVCAHRVLLNSRATLSQKTTETAERVIQEILNETDVPI